MAEVRSSAVVLGASISGLTARALSWHFERVTIVERDVMTDGADLKALERVHAVASVDPIVCRRFFDVLNLPAPPTSLRTPAVAWRVLARSPPAGTGSPIAADGRRAPSTVG